MLPQSMVGRAIFFLVAFLLLIAAIQSAEAQMVVRTTFCDTPQQVEEYARHKGSWRESITFVNKKYGKNVCGHQVIAVAEHKQVHQFVHGSKLIGVFEVQIIGISSGRGMMPIPPMKQYAPRKLKELTRV